MKYVLSLIAAWAIILSGTASAVIRHVPGDYPTIQAAINAANNADMVLVADGIYAENINFSGKVILVTSENGPDFTTIEIQTTGQPVVTFNHGEGRGSVLSGFTVEGDSSSWGIHTIGASPTIYNNIVKKHEIGIRVDNGGSPLIRKNEITLCSHSDYSPHNGGAIRMQQAVAAVIDSNEIHHNYANVAGATYLWLCENVIVERNLIYSNSAIYVGGLEISTCDSIFVYNNTFVDNTSIDTYLGSINISRGTYVSVFNNISAFNNEYGICNYYNNPDLETRYNDVYGNYPDNYYQWGPGTGDISVDPLFVDLANEDFNLGAGSPCINTGDPYRPFDPDGTISDMGAFYYDVGPLYYGSLAGTVTDTFGAPMQNVHVVEPYYGQEDWTDINGGYLMDSLVAWFGYDIQFSYPDFFDTTIYDVEITQHDTAYIDVVMTPLPEPGAISGIVTDEFLIPIESVYVTISDSDLETYTDTDGGFLFLDLFPQAYDLVFSRPDYVPQTYDDVLVVTNDTTELNVILFEYGAVTGTVADTSGSSIVNVIVTDINSGYKDTTLADGSYVLNQLLPAAHDIMFFHNQYVDTTVTEVMVVSGQTTVLDVTLSDWPSCDYVVGDVNFSGSFNILDPLYAIYYFMGIVSPAFTCACTPGNVWYVQGDVNGSCNYTGADFNYMLNYFRQINDAVTPCQDCPPVEWPLSSFVIENIIKDIDFDYSSPLISPKEQKKPDSILLTDEGVEIWFGNLDGSSIDVIPGEQVEIDVYIQTASDAHVGCFNLPLGADGQYISGFLSDSLGEFYGTITDWDFTGFLPVEVSPPNPPGWIGQSLMAFIETGAPPSPTWPWLHYHSPTRIATFVLQTIYNPSFANQTIQCIGPGISSRNGAAVFGDTEALTEYEVLQHFSPIHFLTPPDAGAISGTVNDNFAAPLEGALVSVIYPEMSDTTDINGVYFLGSLAPGVYDLVFSKAGYEDYYSDDVSVTSSETTILNVTLTLCDTNFYLIYGNRDGTSIYAPTGTEIDIQVWGATPPCGSPDSVVFMHIPLGSNDSVIAARLGGYFPDTLVGRWDDRHFPAPDPDQPIPGWTSQSMLGFADLYGPPEPEDYFWTDGDTVLICTFTMQLTTDSSLAGQTLCPFAEGYSPFTHELQWVMQDNITDVIPTATYPCLFLARGPLCYLIPGDINGSGDATPFADVVYFVNSFRTGPPTPAGCECAADVNGNGIVNGVDINYLINYWEGALDILLESCQEPTNPDPVLPPSGWDAGFPDTIIIGNLDGTPIYAAPGGAVDIPIWVKNDEKVAGINISIAANDAFIDQWNGGMELSPLSAWDDCGFYAPTPDQPMPGYTSQSIYGWADISSPLNPFLNTNGIYQQIAVFELEVGSDLSEGDTIRIIPGVHPRAGLTVFCDSAGYEDWAPAIVEGHIVIGSGGPSGCDYVVGDVNSSGAFNGLDVTYGVNFFKGGPTPLYSCECTPGDFWFVAGDINNSCSYNGLDITYGVSYFKGGPGPIPCADCSPPRISAVRKSKTGSGK